jgi:hypothetical protein
MTTTAPNIDSAAVDLWPELGDAKPADSAPEAGVIVAATLAVERSSRALAHALAAELRPCSDLSAVTREAAESYAAP